ncbi:MULTISPECIES: hypothetical protein [unclassified Pseudovibrio]|uniref:hypothetical protein n=1 Tax=unclassified Pseudovibrio TaxID=2627060 RepID=UPI00128FFA80|nr:MULTISPECIES: hypothetical protein [unclassified Pseudovibrio]
MGIDIISWAERKTSSGYEPIDGDELFEDHAPFGWKSYRIFSFLAGVPNYSEIKPISEPRGLPDDVSNEIRENYNEWLPDGREPSWISIRELNEFEYDQQIEDRRDGRNTVPIGHGLLTTYRKYLDPAFFPELRILNECNADRIVFWFY